MQKAEAANRRLIPGYVYREQKRSWLCGKSWRQLVQRSQASPGEKEEATIQLNTGRICDRPDGRWYDNKLIPTSLSSQQLPLQHFRTDHILAEHRHGEKKNKRLRERRASLLRGKPQLRSRAPSASKRTNKNKDFFSLPHPDAARSYPAQRKTVSRK